MIHVGKIGSAVGECLGFKVDACPLACTDVYGLTHFFSTGDWHHADRKCSVGIDVDMEFVHRSGVDIFKPPPEVTQGSCSEFSHIVGIADFLRGVSCAATPDSEFKTCRRIGVAVD